jgi:hypothetical protein
LIAAGVTVRVGLLAAGDLSALLLFTLLGRRSHEEGTALGAALETALPFVAGWAVALITLHLASGRSLPAPRSAVKESVRSAARVWVVAFPVAVLMRALLLGRFNPWTFYFVAFVTAFALVGVWRVAFALGERHSPALRGGR